MGGNNKDKWLRRQAIQIASQLPDDTSDAVSVLKYAHDIVERFLEEEPKQRPVCTVFEIAGHFKT